SLSQDICIILGTYLSGGCHKRGYALFGHLPRLYGDHTLIRLLDAHHQMMRSTTATPTIKATFFHVFIAFSLRIRPLTSRIPYPHINTPWGDEKFRRARHPGGFIFPI